MNILKKSFKNFKKFNFVLFFSLCAMSLVPAVYGIIRTYILSANIPSAEFDILGQMEWFDLINETLLAFLTIPLYSVLNKTLINKKDEFGKYAFKGCFISFLVYLVFAIVVYFTGEYMIRAMEVPSESISSTRTYLQLETIAFSIGFLVSYSNVVFVVLEKKKYIIISLILRLLVTIASDFFLIPNFGVNGVAFSNILINGLLAIIIFAIMFFLGDIKVSWFKKQDLSYGKMWLKEGLFSGLQSFIDNFIYIVMIAKMVNLVAEQGNYWIANDFIWTCLLIPVLALSEVIKADCKKGYSGLFQGNYYLIIAFITIIWLITMPTWILFFQYVEGLENYKEINTIVMKLFVFYIFYSLTVVPDSIFVGLGKMKYSFINSLMINLVYYGLFFILYKTNSIVFTMDVIILMFGFGMVAHEAISIVEEKVFLRKEMKKYEISIL